MAKHMTHNNVASSVINDYKWISDCTSVIKHCHLNAVRTMTECKLSIYRTLTLESKERILTTFNVNICSLLCFYITVYRPTAALPILTTEQGWSLCSSKESRSEPLPRLTGGQWFQEGREGLNRQLKVSMKKKKRPTTNKTSGWGDVPPSIGSSAANCIFCYVIKVSVAYGTIRDTQYCMFTYQTGH